MAEHNYDRSESSKTKQIIQDIFMLLIYVRIDKLIGIKVWGQSSFLKQMHVKFGFKMQF